MTLRRVVMHFVQGLKLVCDISVVGTEAGKKLKRTCLWGGPPRVISFVSDRRCKNLDLF